MDRGQYKQAVSKLELATGILRTNAQAWNYLGIAYHYSGRPEDAKKAYVRALNFDRGLSEARFNLGCLHFEMNQLDQAKSDFTAFTLENEQNADGFLKLGTMTSRSGDLTGAEKAFQRALKISPGNPEALTGIAVVRQKRGRTVEATEFLSRALKADPQYAPALLNYAVIAQHSLKDRQLALRFYQQYLALKPLPTNSGPVIVAATDLQRELLAPASRSAQATNKLPNGQTGFVAARAQPAGVASGPPGATSRTAPVETAKLPPEPATRTGGHIGSTARATGTTSAAKTAGTVQPEKRSIINRIFGGKQDTTNKAGTVAQTPGGSAHGSKGYRYKNPPKPFSGDRVQAQRLFDQAIAARKQLRVTDAVKLYQQSIRSDPSFFNAQFNLAVTLAELGDLQGAANTYEAALAIRPDSLDARYNFALLLKQMEYPLDSVRELEKLAASHPKDARAYVMLGNIYSQQLNQNPRAREYYTKAIEADPNNPQAAAIRQWLADQRN